MTDFLVKRFVKDYENTEKMSVRTAYGVLASIVGIFCNVLLFGIKFTIGALLRSVSVMADGFNNLSDAGSSVISFVGVKMASKPADEEHPFGHGRMEYIAALVVSFLVIDVGFSFFKDSIGRIRNPLEIQFQPVALCILIVSIGIKLWLGLFNKKLGEKLDSKVMMAVFTDSMGDVLATAATILSIIISKVWGINIDGFVGIAVSIVVMKAGIGIAKDTLEPLLGEAVPKEIYERITSFVEGYDGVYGTHDLIVHNYGPGKSMASLHVEVPNDVDIEVSHEIVDRIEREARKALGVYLVIHMDPIEMKNEKTLMAREQVEKVIRELDDKLSIHDFRMVDGERQINLIFDVVIPNGFSDTDQQLKEKISQAVKQLDERYEVVLTLDRDYISHL